MGESDIAIIAGATEVKGLMSKLSKQLELAGIPFVVDEQIKYTNPVGRTLGVLVASLERLLERTSEFKYLVWVDAWDVLFYGTKEELIAEVAARAYGTILLGSERNCWPDAYLSASYPGKTPWRFANTGTIAGRRDNLMRLVGQIKSHPAYHPDYIDQQWFNHRLLEGWGPLTLDAQTELVYTMFMERGTLEFKDGKLYNPLCGSRPLFVHFNGNSGGTLWEHIEQGSAAGRDCRMIDEFNGAPGKRTIRVVTLSEPCPAMS